MAKDDEPPSERISCDSLFSVGDCVQLIVPLQTYNGVMPKGTRGIVTEAHVCLLEENIPGGYYWVRLNGGVPVTMRYVPEKQAKNWFGKVCLENTVA
jgi:hypothetical protein